MGQFACKSPRAPLLSSRFRFLVSSFWFLLSCLRNFLRKRMLRIVSALFLVALIGFTSNSLAQSGAPKRQPVLDVDSIDKSVDPCSDFYTYSCGGWQKKNPIPPDQTSWNAYSKLQDDTWVVLREILESAAAPSSSGNAPRQKIGDYYAACMDEQAVEKAGITPLNP